MKRAAKTLLALLPLLSGCTTSLNRAAINNDSAAIARLAKEGADLNAVAGPFVNVTPLMTAAWHGNVEALKALLKAGADPNHGTAQGNPLGWAILGGHLASVRVLLDGGATPTDREMAFARQYNFNAAVDMLEQYKYGAPLARAPQREASEPAAETLPEPAPAPARPAAPAPAAASDADEPRYSAAARPDDYALVVGVQEYDRLPAASHAENDARAVKKHLLALGYPERNVVLLEGKDAVKSRLAAYLEEWLPRNVKPGSTVFFYYSGHGAPDPRTGQAFLVPRDGDAMFLQSTAFPVKQLYADLEKLPAKRIVAALDSCFSGAGGRSVIAAGARPLVTKAEDLRPAGRLSVLAAASGDEITGAIDEQRHGAFTYYLLKGLSEKRRTTKALYDYLLPRVQDEAHRQNREQTPVLLGADAPL